MDRFILLYWVFPVFVALIINEYKEEIFHFVKFKILPDSLKYQLVIGVLSARQNFVQRQAIRDTWLENVKQNQSLAEKVAVKFIVGHEACDVDKDDRLDPLSCTEWPVSTNEVLDKEWSMVHEVDETAESTHNYAVQSLTFRVQHPVLIDKLGIHDESIGEQAVVRLIDVVRQTEITSVEFDATNRGKLVNGFRYKLVEAFILPKGMECSIEAENLSGGNLRLPITDRPIRMQTDNGSGVLHFLRVGQTVSDHYSDPLAFAANHVPVVSLMFKIQDVDELRKHVSGRRGRREERRRAVSEELRLLREEQRVHDDIIGVSVLDVYSNLPHKLLALYQWLIDDMQFHYAMKVDDDCFVDVERILEQLTSHNKQKIWWGRFRHNWAVEHHGKWAEPVLPAAFYPTFACGAGHILSVDMVSWLTDNRFTLHAYQGEDVSLGIWLSAVAPNCIDDFHWQCEKDCLSDMYTMPQLNPDELRTVWQNKQTCGDPCGCS